MKRIFPSFLLLVCNLCFGQVNLNLGLKAYYPFSGNANDVSGNGFNGVPQGNMQLTTDRFGNANSAYQFDGIDDEIIVTDNGQLSSPAFSICYYFTTESSDLQVCVGKINYTTGYAATFNSGVYPTGPSAFFGTMNSLNNCFLQVPNTYTYTIYSPAIINLNQWYCVVNTFENGIEKMYLDGILVGQTTLPFNNATICNNTNLLIGSWWEADPYRFKGKIDDVRIYDRAISEDEVRALCVATTKTDTIINDYTPVLAQDICNNTINVQDASKYNNGDTVLLIQMKGAIIDSTNTANFGTITEYKNAGNYEFNIIKQKTGNTITLLNFLERQYDIPNG
ncbi:MAG: LamG domain-containing protein, partial [Ginsengibacter sp.]